MNISHVRSTKCNQKMHTKNQHCLSYKISHRYIRIYINDIYSQVEIALENGTNFPPKKAND